MADRLEITVSRAALEVEAAAEIVLTASPTSVGADLTALEALTGTGLVARIADDTYALRTLTGPAAGLTVTNGGGVAGNPTLTLANDLAALEGLSGTGVVVRTGTDTMTTRTITAGTGISIADGDGVAGNPTITATGTYSEAQITAAPASSQDNYEPTGWSTATDVRLVPTASVVLRGFAAGTAGRIVQLRNCSTFVVVLQIEASTSTATNRMQTEDRTGTHVILLPGDVVRLVYDGTDTRWTIVRVRSLFGSEHGTYHEWIPVEQTTIPSPSLARTAGSGTFTTPAIATTSFITTKYRFKQTTSGAGSSVAGMRGANHMAALPGNGSGRGGFCFRLGWCLEDYPDNLSSAIVGLATDDSPGVGNDYAELTNSLGFGFSPSHANWRLQHNDGSGVATMDDLGSDYARSGTAWFTGYLYWDPSVSGRVSYAIWREDDVSIAPVVGDVTSDLPTTAMSAYVHICNRASTSVQSISWDRLQMWCP
jgi:hypothetical protein